MPVYTVHLPSRGLRDDKIPLALPGAAAASPQPNPVTKAELVEAVFVPEGFSRAAFWLGPFWLAWHKLWLELLAWVAVFLLLASGEARFVSGWAIFWIAVLLELLLGLEANNLRRASLRRNGYRLADVAAGATLDDAERSFFRRILEPGAAPSELAATRVQSSPPPLPSPSSPHGDVLGLFPLPDDPR
jgi:Protein of unknown function (DUF2628)